MKKDLLKIIEYGYLNTKEVNNTIFTETIDKYFKDNHGILKVSGVEYKLDKCRFYTPDTSMNENERRNNVKSIKIDDDDEYIYISNAFLSYVKTYDNILVHKTFGKNYYTLSPKLIDDKESLLEQDICAYYNEYNDAYTNLTLSVKLYIVSYGSLFCIISKSEYIDLINDIENRRDSNKIKELLNKISK